MPSAELKKYTAEGFFAMTPENNLKRCELINGNIIDFAAPTLLHQDIVFEIHSKIKSFIKDNKGKCKAVEAPFDVRLDDYTVVQPDVLVVFDPDKLKDGKRCNGAPDLVIEVTSSNWKTDCVDKLNLYCNKGVREYWIVDPENNRILVYLFDEKNSYNIYTFEQNVPVGIFDGELNINISEII